jgi:hypothetical protein
MTHDDAVSVFGQHGFTDILLGVGIAGKLAVQMTDASPEEIAEVQIVATSAGMKLVAAVELNHRRLAKENW